MISGLKMLNYMGLQYMIKHFMCFGHHHQGVLRHVDGWMDERCFRPLPTACDNRM